MVYPKHDIQWRYTILVGNRRIIQVITSWLWVRVLVKEGLWKKRKWTDQQGRKTTNSRQPRHPPTKLLQHHSRRRFCCLCFHQHMVMKTTSSSSMTPSTMPRITGWSRPPASRRLVVGASVSASLGGSGGVGGSGDFPSNAWGQRGREHY